jgi:NarL family two-component system response regulator LiaR
VNAVRDRLPRVVVADDHPSVRIAFDRLLKSSCDVVANVSKGSDIVDIVLDLRPDVLVVDLMMPDVDGLEVCRRVKQAAPETDVIIVTAFEDSRVRAIALRDGASAFVPKAGAAASLERTIRRVFDERQAHRGDQEQNRISPASDGP